MDDNNNLVYDGFAFMNRLEKLWNDKENAKPKESRRKYTQSRLAEDLCIDPSQLSKWQKLKQFPAISTLYKIKNYFGCSIDYLIGSEDVITKKEMSLYDLIKELLEFDLSYDCFDFETFSDLNNNGVTITLQDFKETIDGTLPNLADYKGLFDAYSHLKALKDTPKELRLKLLLEVLAYYENRIVPIIEYTYRIFGHF